MANYPKIRTPLVSGLGLNPVDTVVRTNFDYGSSRSRKRFTFAKTIIKASAVYTPVEYAVFVNWYKTTINNGQDYFNLLLDTGYTPDVISCKFTEIYQATKNRGLWSVSMSLEVASTAPENNPLTSDELDAFDSYAANDFAIFETLFNDKINNLSSVWYL